MSTLICNPGLVGLSNCFGLTEYQSKNRGKIIIQKNGSGNYEVVIIAGCGNGNDALIGIKKTYKDALELKKENE